MRERRYKLTTTGVYTGGGCSEVSSCHSCSGRGMLVHFGGMERRGTEDNDATGREENDGDIAGMYIGKEGR